MTAAAKVLMGVAGVLILDALCSVELGVVSWVIVSVPFIMVALASSIALGLGMDRVASKYLQEKFTPLTGDNLKNRNQVVSQLKHGTELPLSSSSLY